MKKIILVIIVVIAINSAYAQQTFRREFKTNGVYGYVMIKTKPTTVGEAYIWIQQTKCVIQGIDNYTGNDLDGISFPIYSTNCYMSVSGDASVVRANYNNPSANPYTGHFSSNNLHYGSSLGKTSPQVGFSDAARNFINKKTRENNSNYWENNGKVDNLSISNVQGLDIDKVVQAKKDKIAKEKRIVEENRRKEEQRIAEENRRREEQRIAEENRRREEQRIAEENRRREEKNNNYSENNSSDYSGNSNSDYDNYWRESKEKQKQLEQNIKKATNDFNNAITNLGNMIVASNQRNEEYRQQKIREDEERERIREEREEQRRREEERRARERRETNRIYYEMTAFESSFDTEFNKNYLSESGDKIYFYLATIKINKQNRRGYLYLSNIFAVPYNNSSSSWPFAPDIKQNIFDKYGKVIIKGYFKSYEDARNDMNRNINNASNHYYSIIKKHYYFEYNFSNGEVNNSNTDFWGNETNKNKNNLNNSKNDLRGKDSKTIKTKTDFWGNETNKNSNTSNNSKNDFGGKDSKTIKTKTDFWGNPIK